MKRRPIAIILAIAVVLLVLCGGFLFAERRGWLFFGKDMLTRALQSADFDVVEVDTVTMSPEELAADARITLDQSGMLVNKAHLLPQDFEAELADYRDTGVMMNRAVTKAYGALSDDVRELFGEKLYIRSSYRSAEEQRQTIATEGDNATAVGASEHQTGLALDVYVAFYAGAGFIQSDVGQWLNGHAQDYGFIIRYPYYGSNPDGIGYEPWHIRYVGSIHGTIMYQNSLTLEEYFDLLADGQWRRHENTLISRQSGSALQLPEVFASATVSPDNTGGYLVTVTVEE